MRLSGARLVCRSCNDLPCDGAAVAASNLLRVIGLFDTKSRRFTSVMKSSMDTDIFIRDPLSNLLLNSLASLALRSLYVSLLLLIASTKFKDIRDRTRAVSALRLRASFASRSRTTAASYSRASLASRSRTTAASYSRASLASRSRFSSACCTILATGSTSESTPKTLDASSCVNAADKIVRGSADDTVPTESTRGRLFGGSVFVVSPFSRACFLV